jgi:dolichol-phosphate mannosyltransferase
MTNSAVKDLLLGIPVYNECRYVEDIIMAVQCYCAHILVVDDGSTDGTLRKLSNFTTVQVIAHSCNQGYGKSIIDIFNYAIEHRYTWVITMDCDFQHEPSHLPRFQERIQKSTADIISGSRYLNGHMNVEHVPKERIEINQRIFDLLNQTLDLELTDAFCGFKAYRVECLKKLSLQETGYGLPLELWIQAAKQQLCVEEIPVPPIYHDPERNFSGELENPEFRLNYYFDILNRNLNLHGYQNTNQISCS